MQHKHRKKYIAAALLVAAISLTGIGLAIAYIGDVVNTGNTTDTKSVVLTLGDDHPEDYTGAFDNIVHYDTYTNASGTTWTPHYDTDTDNDSNTDAVFLGRVTINIDRNGSTDPFSISMTKTAGTMTGDFKVGVKAGSAAVMFMDYYDDVTILDDANDDMIVVVSLYYVSSSVTSEPTAPLDNVTIKFTALAED